MPPIKESLALSGSINENEDLITTGKFNLGKSMRLWNSFEEEVIAEHFKNHYEEDSVKKIK